MKLSEFQILTQDMHPDTELLIFLGNEGILVEVARSQEQWVDSTTIDNPNSMIEDAEPDDENAVAVFVLEANS